MLYFGPMFSKTFGYALRSLIYVAVHGHIDKKIGTLELSEQLDIPQHFLGKIMQDLVRHGMLDSIKGPNGGFYPNESTLGTPMLEVLKMTDGGGIFDQCALHIRRCNSEQPCPLHHEFAVCRNGLLKSFGAKTIGDLTKSVEEGLAFLVR